MRASGSTDGGSDRGEAGAEEATALADDGLSDAQCSPPVRSVDESLVIPLPQALNFQPYPVAGALLDDLLILTKRSARTQRC